MRPHNIFLETLLGLERPLLKELEQLGGNVAHGKLKRGGVQLAGHDVSLYRVVLESRVASKAIVRVGSFRADTRERFIYHMRKLDWSKYFQEGSTDIEFKISSGKSELYHTGLIEEISEVSLRGFYNSSSRNVQKVFISMWENKVSISANGGSMSDRGYRRNVSVKMPLREVFAASSLQSVGVAREDRVIDPFCGSGTFLVEQALLASNTAPGLVKLQMDEKFAFMNWPSFDETRFNQVVEAAQERVIAPPSAPILFGSDRDAGVVAGALDAAKLAGVSDWVTFDTNAFSNIHFKELEPDWIITNPPFGPRAGETANIRPLYSSLGNLIRQECPDVKVAMVYPKGNDVRKHGLYATGLSWHSNPAVSAVIGGRRLDFMCANFKDNSKPLVEDAPTKPLKLRIKTDEPMTLAERAKIANAKLKIPKSDAIEDHFPVHDSSYREQPITKQPNLTNDSSHREQLILKLSMVTNGSEGLAPKEEIKNDANNLLASPAKVDHSKETIQNVGNQMSQKPESKMKAPQKDSSNPQSSTKKKRPTKNQRALLAQMEADKQERRELQRIRAKNEKLKKAKEDFMKRNAKRNSQQ